MRRCLLLVFMVVSVLAQATYSPLEPGSTLRFLGNRIEYKGNTITLSERNIYVDGTLSDEEAGRHPFVYNSFKQAVAHLVDGTEEQPMRMYLAPYVYWADNPSVPKVAVGKNGREPFGMVVDCENLHLIGLSDDARNIVLASQRGQTQGAVGNFTMFMFVGNGLQVSNLTMGNYCNVDLEFPLKPQLGKAKRSSAITQAHVAYCRGDRAVARNVRFISRLNMNPINGARRILYDRCHMECTDDALTGNGVYLNCTFGFYGQKPFYVTHRCGAVFLNCDFYAMGNNSTMVFCKAVGPLSLIDCRYHAKSDISVGWTNYPEPWLRCYQANLKLNGKPYVAGSEMSENTVEIDRFELLKAYKTPSGDYNLYNLLRGDDGWNPTAMTTTTTDMPTALVADKRRLSLLTGTDSAVVTLTAMRHAGYPMNCSPLKWRVTPGADDMVRVEQLSAVSFRITPNNNTDDTKRLSVTFFTGEGLEAAVDITVLPSKLPAPELQKCGIKKCNKNTLVLDYQLLLDGKRDESEITWFRSKDKHGHDAIPVSVTHTKQPTTYALTAADAGYYIGASMRPKSHRSDYGDRVYVSTAKVVKAKGLEPLNVISTDFIDFPCQWQPQIIPGFWTVDGFKPQDTTEYPWSFDKNKNMWAYAKGFNGAVGWGLVQAQRGARMMYTPLDGNYGDMSLVLNVDPTKTAGQGFGSATGQYMDICIKFDTRTLTGYALRIIRTTKHAKAVDFYLVEYKNGVTKAISEPISSGCYRTGCTIRLDVVGSRLTAHVETATPLSDSSSLPTVVDLSADIVPSVYGGVAIQHTGSCGESTTMLHSLKVEWK